MLADGKKITEWKIGNSNFPFFVFKEYYFCFVATLHIGKIQAIKQENYSHKEIAKKKLHPNSWIYNFLKDPENYG